MERWEYVPAGYGGRMRLTWRRGGLEVNVLTDLSLEHHPSDYINPTRTCNEGL